MRDTLRFSNTLQGTEAGEIHKRLLSLVDKEFEERELKDGSTTVPEFILFCAEAYASSAQFWLGIIMELKEPESDFTQVGKAVEDRLHQLRRAVKASGTSAQCAPSSSVNNLFSNLFLASQLGWIFSASASVHDIGAALGDGTSIVRGIDLYEHDRCGPALKSLGR